MTKRYFRLCECVLLALLGISSIPSLLSASTIGLYSEPSGAICSFSGNSPGMVTAYVVIKPDAQGVHAAQFAAAVPACLGATHLYDTAADGVSIVGFSPDGVAISSPDCLDQATLVMSINYHRAGTTTACCEFPIVAHPIAGGIVATTCSFNTTTLTPQTSYFNSDLSCSCHEIPQPSNPDPVHNASAVPVWKRLSWQPGDSELAVASYDVYLGASPTPPLVATVTVPEFQPAFLNASTNYYWRVVVNYELGEQVSGPTWHFTTSVNSPPTIPVYFNPVDGDPNVPWQGTTLEWSSSDPEGGPLTYDVYLEMQYFPLTLEAANRSATTYATGALNPTAFYNWKIVARDAAGQTTSGPVFTFRTGIQINHPPHPASSPSPSDGAVQQPLFLWLSWTASDSDGIPGLPVSFDVYFGTSIPPPLIASGLTGNAKQVNGLSAGTDYYWKVVTRDGSGLQTDGPMWTFHTNSYPSASNPSPPSGATGVSVSPTVTWEVSDPDNNAVEYELAWGTSLPLIVQATNLESPSWNITGLPFNQTIYWQVRVTDSIGFTALGPVWNFNTGSNTPPTQATSPIPAHEGYAGSATSLEWDEATDAESAPVYRLHFGTTNPPPYITEWAETEFPAGPFSPGVEYFWRVDVSDGVTITPGELWTFTGGTQPTGVAPAPTVLTLGRNHPNPFNPQTVIPYGAPVGAAQRVRLVIYDTSGRTVRVLVDEHQTPGMREVTWNGNDDAGARVSSGVYYCVLSLGDDRRTQKLVLLK